MSTRATHTRTHAQHHTNAHDLRVNDVVGGGVGVGATIATHASVKCITAQHNTPPPHTPGVGNGVGGGVGGSVCPADVGGCGVVVHRLTPASCVRVCEHVRTRAYTHAPVGPHTPVPMHVSTVHGSLSASQDLPTKFIA
jgi:hypothetical protein